ncbi:MAG: hypothetical protein AAF517_24865 [Planctomycetota bacterium]
MKLPSESDFDPERGGLDEQWAWREFEGLTVDQAFAKFLKSPSVYDEAFMFMGGAAFAFYFPVIERYLRESRAGEGDDVESVSFIAEGILLQWEWPTWRLVLPLRDRILELCREVLSDPSRYFLDEREQRRAVSAWRKLESRTQVIVERRDGEGP